MDDKAKFLSSLKSRCPATIFAESRIERVIGRIIFLVNSIKTIKFISAPGVPVGTVWASICFVLFSQPKIIIAIHIVRAVGKAIIICAVGVKVNGERAEKLIINIEINTISIVLLIPLCKNGFRREFSSFLSGIKIKSIFNIHLAFFFLFF